MSYDDWKTTDTDPYHECGVCGEHRCECERERTKEPASRLPPLSDRDIDFASVTP